MKKAFKQLTTALLVCATLTASAFALAPNTVTDTASIGGSSAALVYMTMGNGRTGEITLAQDSVSSAQSADAHLAAKRADGNKTIVAAVNGGYFDAYSGANTTFATVIQGGRVVNGGGNKPTLGFTSDGTPLIDRVKITTAVKFREGQPVTTWSVNNFYDDANSVSLFTTALGGSTTIPSTAKMVYLKDGVVSDIRAGSTLTVPSGTQVLTINAGQWAALESYSAAPRVGNTAEIITSYAPSKGNADTWSTVVNAVGAGPILLLDGKDVTAQNGDFADPKQSVTVSSARSFAAIMKDGRLVLGAASATMKEITAYLQSVGAVDAMALDGGASSMLYATDAGYLRAAGRQLSNVLQIVDYTGGSVPQIPRPTVKVQAPSAWAADTVSAAIASSLVPQPLQSNYQQNITREEFCSLIIPLLKSRMGNDKYVSTVYSTGVTYDQARARYTDTFSNDVIACTQLALVSGKSAGKFDPNANLTRQEAAKILAATAQVGGIAQNGNGPTFADAGSIAPWATDSVGYVCGAGIMNGGDGNRFNPTGYFTREQAISTIYRMK